MALNARGKRKCMDLRDRSGGAQSLWPGGLQATGPCGEPQGRSSPSVGKDGDGRPSWPLWAGMIRQSDSAFGSGGIAWCDEKRRKGDGKGPNEDERGRMGTNEADGDGRGRKGGGNGWMRE